jgi:hypothetical protein
MGGPLRVRRLMARDNFSSKVPIHMGFSFSRPRRLASAMQVAYGRQPVLRKVLDDYLLGLRSSIHRK